MIQLADAPPDLRVLNLRTRMPFRFGITTMTVLPHLLVRLEVVIDGQQQVGVAADHLPPKWFTKDPSTSFREDVEEMLTAIRGACDLARGAPSSATLFGFWRHLYEEQRRQTVGRVPPLLSNFGVSLVERAVIDAFCRVRGTTFAKALRVNDFGIRLGELHPELADAHPADFLPPHPLRQLAVRHTVGLGDPLTDEEVPEVARLADGLPQSLDACIRAYGLRYFKIKIGGDPHRDVDRLRGIARVLEGAAIGHYRVTLDGNEQYRDVASFRDAWRRLTNDSRIAAFMRRLLFVEQPLHRDVTLSDATRQALLEWKDRPPIIIDEADASVESLPAALASGYAGTSHKNCKGIFKGVAGACLLEHRRRSAPGRRTILSAEDLTNIGPVALQQDLAVVATLGIPHVERNGHHYFAGLSMFPASVQDQVQAAHPDLFHRRGGFVALDIRDGILRSGSVVDSPFGMGFDLVPDSFTPLDVWSFDSLGVERDGLPEGRVV